MTVISTAPEDLAYLATLTPEEFEKERIRLVSAEIAAMPERNQVQCSRLQAACNQVHDACAGKPMAALEVMMPQLQTLSKMLIDMTGKLEGVQ